MNIFLCPNTDPKYKKTCLDYMGKACEILRANGCGLYADNSLSDYIDIQGVSFGETQEIVPLCDFILVSGGDGTILRHAKKLSQYGKAILGLNSGRLGFMATLEHDEMELLEDFCKGNYYVSERMMLEAKVFLKSGESHCYTALNDVVMMKSVGCKIADYEVSKRDTVVSSLRADGLIFSTPTGASAYSLSAGGPLIEPELECIEFTQICPHSLFARSMIFSPDSVLKARFETNNNAKVILSIDGVNEVYLTQDDYVLISQSESTVKLIDITGNSFTNSINKKLMMPLKGN